MPKAKKPLKLVSWNVNGVRAAKTKGFGDYVAREAPDIICLQETKCQEGQVEIDLPEYEEYWHCAEKKGYSGTAVFTKQTPLAVTQGLGRKLADTEGRVMTVEYEMFYLVNVYTPNAQRTLDRHPFRTTEWDPAFLAHVKSLDKRKPVLFCGDLNVAHTEIDLANPKANKKNAGFTPEERAGFDKMLAAGFIDTFREFEKGPGHYSWWSQRPGVRERNIGWRIDYFLASERLRPALRKSYIRPDVRGSDHCPVVLEIDCEKIVP